MEQTICIFGDSITWGAHDDDCGGWANRLQAYCFASHERPDIYNLGVPGDTTRDVLQRLENEMIAREPTHVLFAIGINDSQFNTQSKESKTSLNEFKKNIGAIVNIAETKKVTVAFMGLIRVDEAKTLPRLHRPEVSYGNQRIAEYDKAIQDFCKQKNIPYLEVSSLVDKEELPDGLHPNAAGHKKVFEVVKKFLGI